ncbi:MAG: ribonuclease III [Kiritimatiellae bacterium]|nr:ribonuclease III [Kiritimatiellia bacterium]
MFGLRKNPYRALEKTLGYRFRKRSWLEEALTHPSYRAEHDEVITDYQRLEFLGDAALNLVVGAHLFHENPDAAEGPLTQMRSAVTSRRALAVIGADLGLGPHLRLGRGEHRAGGAARESVLEDAMEAVLGAVFLDGGLRGVEKVFSKWIEPRLRTEDDEPIGEFNPKGELQRLCQSKWHVGPRYEHTNPSGPEHRRRFTAIAFLDERELGRGQGPNKKAAEIAAAEAALHSLQHKRRRGRRGGRRRWGESNSEGSPPPS